MVRRKVFQGDRLRRLREARGLSQDDMEERLGLGNGQLYRYENGKSEPSTETLVRVAQEFEVSVDYLLGLVDMPQENLTPKDYSEDEHELVAAFRRADWQALMRIASEATQS